MKILIVFVKVEFGLSPVNVRVVTKSYNYMPGQSLKNIGNALRLRASHLNHDLLASHSLHTILSVVRVLSV